MRASNKLFVFSDPHKSKEHGYNFDGWADGDDLWPVFDYTGTGPVGHQKMPGLNGTLLNHTAQGLELYLFISDGYIKPGGAKKQRFVGRMQVDAVDPYIERWDYDSTGTCGGSSCSGCGRSTLSRPTCGPRTPCRWQ